MAGKHYFGNVSVSGFVSSSESEDGWMPGLYRDPEAQLHIEGYPTPAVIGGEGVMICEDLDGLCTVDASEDVLEPSVNQREPNTSGRGRSGSADAAIRGPLVNPGKSPSPTRGRSRSVGAAPVADDGVIDQPDRVVQLDGTDDVQQGEMQGDDSGYETMNAESAQDDAETKTGRAHTTMDAVETDGEPDAAVSGGSSIIIYCVCCSKQVESPANLKNRLCKECIDIMTDDSGMVVDDCNETLSNTLSVPCAVCSKRFEKSACQPHQVCKECISNMVEGCKKEHGVETHIIGCSCCHRPFTQKSDKLHENLCPQCKYVTVVQPLREPLPHRVQQPRRQVDYPGWTDAVALQGYTAIIVKAHMRTHFYKWCDGHRTDNEAQEAHQCLEKSYAADVARRVCNILCPFTIVRMIKSMQTGYCLRLGTGAEGVVSKALWVIQRAADPFLKMKDLNRGYPECVRTYIEKVVAKWGNRLCPARHRGIPKPLRCKLTY